MMTFAELFGTPRALARDLAVATGLGMLLGVLGPFGSFYAGPLEVRLFYWTANLWFGFLLISVAVRLSLRAAQRLDLPVWFALPAGVAAAAVPLSAAVDLFSAYFWPGRHARLGPALEAYGQTLAISEPAALLFYILDARHPTALRQEQPAEPRPSPPAAAGGPGRFADRLSARVGRELLCLQMEDHYVRAHTARGSELVLLPLKDALVELGDADGLQVHRSWWVARPAVAEVVRDGRNIRLRLVNGVEAPVSRTSLSLLREAGWLDAPPPEPLSSVDGF